MSTRVPNLTPEKIVLDLIQIESPPSHFDLVAIPDIGYLSQTALRIVGNLSFDWIVIEHNLNCQRIINVEPEGFLIRSRQFLVVAVFEIGERLEIAKQFNRILLPLSIMNAALVNEPLELNVKEVVSTIKRPSRCDATK
jgi:hypothetical protein